MIEPTTLTENQRKAFERDGFLVIPNALPPEMVARLTEAVDRLYAQGVAKEGLSKANAWNLRNCIGADPVLLELLDYRETFPLVVDLLNWNLHLITSHLIVRAPSPSEANERWKAEGWHRDGGTSSVEMEEPHPRLFIKIAYWLTDLSETGRGNIRFVPGSHRMMGRPAQAEDAPDPYGAVEICVRPGDATLFEQRTWHAVGANVSNITRKSLFYGYGYRWIHPMDYKVQPTELLEQCNPIQRQLLGDTQTPLGNYIPQDIDVPLRAWQEARHQTQTK